MISAARAAHTGRLDTLAVDGGTEGDRVLPTARGELVRGCTQPLTRALPAGVAGVGLDASGVAFLDTTGLAGLDTLSKYGRRHRVLELAGPDPVNTRSRPSNCACCACCARRSISYGTPWTPGR